MISKKEREFGIDALKAVSMLMIVILHCIGQGGVIDNTSGFTNQLFCFVRSFCYCAVCVYAITTGYLCVSRRSRYERIIELWLEVFVYSILLYLAYALIKRTFSIRAILSAILPVTLKEYWYFSCYFVLALLIPFFNPALLKLSSRQWRILLVTLGGLSFLSLFSYRLGIDFLKTNNGYSPLWLSFMYILGAYAATHKESLQSIPKWKWLVGYLVLSVITYLSKLIISAATTLVIGEPVFDKLFWSDMAPAIVGAAFCLFQLFSKIPFRRTAPFWKLASATSFGVYLIHTHPQAADLFLTDIFTGYLQLSPMPLLAIVLGYALLLYLACSVIDYARIKLFSLLHIDRLSARCVSVIRRIVFIGSSVR